MLGEHPSIEIPQSTEYAKEMRRWEALHTRYGPPGRPYQFVEYPKTLYKVAHVHGEGLKITEQSVVNDADQERNLNSRGFYPLAEAGRRAEQEQTEHGRLAAEREWQIQHGRLSERATAEVRAAEAEHGATHLPDVPETPIRRRPKPSEA